MPRAMLEQVEMPLDELGFLRRECGQCHRAFKVRPSPAIERQAMNQVAQRAVVEAEGPEPQRHCPYCGSQAPEGAWLTAKQSQYLAAWAEHWAQEVQFLRLSQPRRTLGANPRLTYLPVEPTDAAPPSPPAEPSDDLRSFPVLCCRDAQLVDPTWREPVRCHFCGLAHHRERVAPWRLALFAPSSS